MRIVAQHVRFEHNRYIAWAFTSGDETIEKQFDSDTKAWSWLNALVYLINMDVDKIENKESI